MQSGRGDTGAEEPVAPGNFYGRETSNPAAALREAAAVQGLADEIALMRVRLREASKAHPDDLKLLLAGVGMLVRAVAAEYRLSPKSKKEFAENLAALLNGLGDQLLPPDR